MCLTWRCHSSQCERRWRAAWRCRTRCMTTAGACSTVVVARGGRVILTASESNGMYFINGLRTAGAAALVDPHELSSAVTWHRRLGHPGFSTLADIPLSNLIHGRPVTPGAFLQAQKQQSCESCIATKMRRTSATSCATSSAC